MQNASIEEDRNVIPRWRSPRVADGWELAAARDLGRPPLTEQDFADELKLWRTEKTLAASIDIYDTGIIIGDQRVQLEGAGPILSNADRLPPALLDEVRRSLAQAEDLQLRRSRLARLEISETYLRRTIRMLKRRLIDHPRDVLALLEISRLHVLLGQANVAERYVRSAIALAPNDRLVLRSATQYYKLIGSLETVLPALRANDVVTYDPLLQSTEIAASSLSGKGSRFALSALRSMKGLREVGLRRSELALAVATVERNAGMPQRRIFQLVRAGMVKSTENAQAQAVWLGEQEDRPLGAMLPDLTLADNAYEAHALARFEAEDYIGAAKAAGAWLADQPFEPEPVNVICNCHSIYLQTPGDAISIANHAFTLHPDNWMVQNAILLVYIGVGQLDRADVVLGNLTRLASTPTVQAFAFAGAGMLAFARGQFGDGRSDYEKAIHAARKARRQDLVYSAAAFWALAEVRSGLVSRLELNILNDRMLENKKRLPIHNRDYANKLWKTIHSQALAAVDSIASDYNIITNQPLEQMARSLPDYLKLDAG